MDALQLDRLLELVNWSSLVFWAIWVGLIWLTIAIPLTVMMYTRWGQSKPLGKCLILSAVAHLLVAIALFTCYVAPSAPIFQEPEIHVAIAEKPGEQKPPETFAAADAAGSRISDPANREGHSSAFRDRPWEAFGQDSNLRMGPSEVARAVVQRAAEVKRRPLVEAGTLPEVPSAVRPLVSASAPLVEPAKVPSLALPEPLVAAEKRVEPIDAPQAQRRAGAEARLPGGPGPQRQSPGRITAPQPAGGPRENGLPSALLERPLTPLRMTDIPAAAEPEKTLGRVSDAASAASPGKPVRADLASSDGGRTASASDAAGRDPSSPSELVPGAGFEDGMRDASTLPSSLTGHLKPPSMASDRPTEGDPQEAATGPVHAGVASGPSGNGAGGPELYSLRRAPNRLQIAQQHGAKPEVEQAVTDGLRWIAENQGVDGRWSAKQHEGGREIVEAGRDRNGAGGHADAGVTALALLALAASGNTHQEGVHQQAVRKGVGFLLALQASDGSLGGDGEIYEYTYCHGMATLALGEILGMTDDPKLRGPVKRAIGFTLSCQDPSGGGWRYRRQEPGDTSQLGWQLMALKSAELAQIEIPAEAWQGARRFLDSVSSGNHHGLASYRPGENYTRSMTAEALACRQFLGLTPGSPTSREAGDYLLGELPGDGAANLYYWYYGTMATYQLQGEHWKRWNEALQRALLTRQRKSGPLAGSWDPDGRWDGYGGRVYSTALATLCLEAYYRFFPLNSEPPVSDRH